MGGLGTYHPFGVIQGVVNDSHLGHQGFRHDRFAFVVLIVRGKLQLVDGMTEIVSDAIFFQVRDQLINVSVVRRLEGATRGEVDVSGDLVDTETTRNIATLVRLFPQFVGPTLFHTLVYPIKPGVRGECTQENVPT